MLQEMMDKINAAGGDQPKVFGGTNFGGYLIQQNPEEFAQLILFLKEKAPFNVYLEIGSASGGNLRFLTENVTINEVITMDNGRHPHSAHQEGHYSAIRNSGKKVTSWRGNSHEPEALQFLISELDGKLIDLAFIDGDHSHIGVVQDYEMVKPYLSPSALVIFHDIVAAPSVASAVSVLKNKYLNEIITFVSSTKTMGISVCGVK